MNIFLSLAEFDAGFLCCGCNAERVLECLSLSDVRDTLSPDIYSLHRNTLSLNTHSIHRSTLV